MMVTALVTVHSRRAARALEMLAQEGPCDVSAPFVAAVEFGPRVKAKAVTAGGESGDPASPHFTDQAARYAAGDLRPIYFYAEDLKGHVERRYHPGQ